MDATSTYLIPQSSGTGDFVVAVPVGSDDQIVTLLGLQMTGNTAFVYVRYNDSSSAVVPFGYLAIAGGQMSWGNSIPVQLRSGTKEIVVTIAVSLSDVLLFFNVT